MSANSDARKMLNLAHELGLDVVKAKHGGYAITDGDEVVARIPGSGKGRLHWVKKARRALEGRSV